jgi:hypothetical protein
MQNDSLSFFMLWVFIFCTTGQARESKSSLFFVIDNGATKLGGRVPR